MQIFTESKLTQVQNLFLEKKNFVITAHKSPDGDSIGSSVALYHYLKKKKINVTICHPDPHPYFLDWMKGTETIINYEQTPDAVKAKLEEADVIFCLDFNTLNRIGGMSKVVENSKAEKIMIDHHLHPSDEFDINFSDPASCSTAQLIADFILCMNDEQLLDENIGEAIYTGIMTDTGSFRFSSVTSHTHEVIALLMKYGVKPYKIHEAVFDTNTLDKLRLRSYAINEKLEIIPDSQTAIISLTQAELKKYNYVKGDTEGLVNVGLSINGIKRSIFLKEDGIIKISFRSKGENNPVNVMAATHFEGGGHANASGGKWNGTLAEAIQKIKNVLPEYD
ncbi:phosphoesterase [Brumimicrobium salinarum]|uniref:Phosphoesterase n=1 Tax=Brumimicrobium salinarum TaxID=2058658 RepID=A0A2I0R118_9FLAO|nr:bifunctional oligoribonuclease/PAP phosphatase NrnA [Brumimicrobium salinarum]PKR80090.1 phosphoesterase [Brumimicrobium salinarum]